MKKIWKKKSVDPITFKQIRDLGDHCSVVEQQSSHFGSSFMGAQPLDTSKRHDKIQKTKVDAPTPAVVKSYNKHKVGLI